LFIAGIATPSPTPIMARAASSTGSPICAANGVSTVAMDHHTTPNPRTFLPPYRSAQTPPATCVSRYPQKKLDCTRPTVCVSQPYCAAIGMIATAMLTRSRLHAQNATKHISTIQVRRACSHEAGAAGGLSSEFASRAASAEEGGGGRALGGAGAAALRLACCRWREGKDGRGGGARGRRDESLAAAASAAVAPERDRELEAEANAAERALSLSSAAVDWLGIDRECAYLGVTVGVERKRKKWWFRGARERGIDEKATAFAFFPCLFLTLSPPLLYLFLE
jgi:hypothetical protein